MTRIYLSPPDLSGGELRLVSDALASGWVAPLGPHVEAFEAEMSERVQMSHALALSSGTAALHLALLVLGVGRGDRVWLSSFTFAATANAVAYVGATPVFVDSDRTSWNLDPGLLCEELARAAHANELPKALIVVDLYGQSADYEPIVKACRSHGVWLIEDAAEALGATYRGRPAGSFGDLSVFSFNGNKIVTTSGGGMLLAGRSDWIERARYLATQAREPVAHYEHREIGYNYRLSNLLAAVGRAQLSDLDRRVAARRGIFARYQAELGDLEGWSFMPEASFGSATRWLTCALLPSRADRDRVLAALGEANIEARPLWKPMHAQPVFAGARVFGGAVSSGLFDVGLCLPSGSGMTAEQQARVIGTIRATWATR